MLNPNPGSTLKGNIVTCQRSALAPASVESLVHGTWEDVCLPVGVYINCAGSSYNGHISHSTIKI